MTDFAFSFNGIVSPGLAKVFKRAAGASERARRVHWTGQVRRPPRAVTEKMNRARKGLRRCLVHDAGCVREDGRWHRESWAFGDLTYIPGALSRCGNKPVSVPRSLRPLLGRWIGGGQ